MRKKQEKSDGRFNVLVAFEIDGVGRWEVGDPLAVKDIPAKNLKTLLADGDIEEVNVDSENE